MMYRNVFRTVTLVVMIALAFGCSKKKKSSHSQAEELTAESVGEAAVPGSAVVTREIDGEVIVIDKLLSGDKTILNNIEKISPEPGDGSAFLTACTDVNSQQDPMMLALKEMVQETDCLRAHDKLIYMREFWVSTNRNLTDLTLLAKFKNVRLLHLSDNKLSDIRPLAELVNLEVLHLDNNKISDIQALSQLVKLYSLNLTGNAVVDISPLQNLIKLKFLVLDFNLIEDTAPLAGLPAVTNLLLSANRIQDISPLGQMASLQILHLSSNPVVDLGPLANLSQLTTLHVVSSQVNSLVAIAPLNLLVVLDARNNPVGQAKSEASCPTTAASPAVRDFCLAP